MKRKIRSNFTQMSERRLGISLRPLGWVVLHETIQIIVRGHIQPPFIVAAPTDAVVHELGRCSGGKWAEPINQGDP